MGSRDVLNPHSDHATITGARRKEKSGYQLERVLVCSNRQDKTTSVRLELEMVIAFTLFLLSLIMIISIFLAKCSFTGPA